MARKSRKKPLLLGNTVPETQQGIVEEQSVSVADGKIRLATAAYARLSIENNGHETDDSIQTQIKLVESYIQENEELELAETYVDNGYSGTKFDRPEFMRMMEDVKSGKIQCIVVKEDCVKIGLNQKALENRDFVM